MANFEGINTRQPIAKTFVTCDYGGDSFTCATSVQICPRGLLRKWVKYDENYFFIYTNHKILKLALSKLLHRFQPYFAK